VKDPYTEVLNSNWCSVFKINFCFFCRRS